MCENGIMFVFSSASLPKFITMKINRLIIVLLVTLSLSTACTRKTVIVKTTPSGKIPPGQAKKMTGSKSAKPYAPGQQKKG